LPAGDSDEPDKVAYPAKIYRTITKQFYERLPAAFQKRISNAAAKHNQQTVNIEI
jgi:hypothetical protein